jgi:hypothetical protein
LEEADKADNSIQQFFDRVPHSSELEAVSSMLLSSA